VGFLLGPDCNCQRVNFSVLFGCCLLVTVIECLERLVSKMTCSINMTYYVLSSMLNTRRDEFHKL